MTTYEKVYKIIKNRSVFIIKTDELFNDADHYLAEYIHSNKIREYNFLEIILFSPNNFKTKLEYEA
jgi:hypothetical protein